MNVKIKNRKRQKTVWLRYRRCDRENCDFGPYEPVAFKGFAVTTVRRHLASLMWEDAPLSVWFEADDGEFIYSGELMVRKRTSTTTVVCLFLSTPKRSL